MLLLLACEPTAIDNGPTDSDAVDDVAPVELTWTRMNDLSHAKGVDLAVAPDGVLYASFVYEDEVYIQVSDDGGATWDDPVSVNTQHKPAVHGVSHPEVDVDDDRVLISLATGQYQGLFVARRDTLSFENVTWLHGGETWQFEAIFFQGRLAPDGDIWGTIHAFPKGSWNDGWKGIARQSNGFHFENVSDPADGLPCECCPHDLIFLDDGSPAMAWRGNVNDVRDMWFAGGEAMDRVVQAGDLGVEIGYCPVQGPRLAQAPDGELWMVWADAMGGPYAPYLARSDDQGATWSSAEMVFEDLADDIRPSPTVAIADDGRALVTWTPDIGTSGMALHRNDAWEEVPLDQGLRQVEVVAGGDWLGGVGVTEAGEVWAFQLR